MSPTTRVRKADPDRGTAVETFMPGRYDGRVAVVTGAASGIGRATARRLAAEGAAVACLDINEAVAAVAEKINDEAADKGGRALALQCDVTDEQAVATSVARTTDELGIITNLCNIAGIGSFCHTTEESLSRWEEILAVNLTGTFLMCRAVLPALLEHGGAIVNTVSSAGIKGQPYSVAYCAVQRGRADADQGAGGGVHGPGCPGERGGTGRAWTPRSSIVSRLPEDADFTLIGRAMTPFGYAHPARDGRRLCLPGLGRGGLCDRDDPLGGRSDHRLSHVQGSPVPSHASGERRACRPRLRVALDATPLLGTPDGCRRLLPGSTPRPGARADLDVRAFAVSWRRRAGIGTRLPATVAAVQRPMPARPLHALWGRGAWPPVEWFIGGVDVVHGTNFVVPPSRRAAEVVSVHDLTPLHHPELCNPATLAYPGLIRRALRRGAWVHTDSAFVAGEVVEAFGADPARVRVVAPGRAAPARHRAARGARRCVAALPPRGRGTLHPGHRHGRAPQGSPGPGPRLRPSGRSPRRPGPGTGRSAGVGRGGLSRPSTRRGRGHGWCGTGWLEPTVLAALLQEAAVLAFPSLYEGFGFPPLEAMAAGVPVVATRAGSLPEVLGDGAVLVDVGDDDGLVDALDRVLDDPALRERAGGRRGGAGGVVQLGALRGRPVPALPRRGRSVAVADSPRVLMAVEQLRRAVPGGIGAYARGCSGGMAQCAEDGDEVDVTLLASRYPGRLGGDRAVPPTRWRSSGARCGCRCSRDPS